MVTARTSVFFHGIFFIKRTQSLQKRILPLFIARFNIGIIWMQFSSQRVARRRGPRFCAAHASKKWGAVGTGPELYR